MLVRLRQTHPQTAHPQPLQPPAAPAMCMSALTSMRSQPETRAAPGRTNHPPSRLDTLIESPFSRRRYQKITQVRYGQGGVPAAADQRLPPNWATPVPTPACRIILAMIYPQVRPPRYKG